MKLKKETVGSVRVCISGRCGEQSWDLGDLLRKLPLDETSNLLCRREATNLKKGTVTLVLSL
jgi:hypothetical protein